MQALQIKFMGGELSRRKGSTQYLEIYQLFLKAGSAKALNTESAADAAADYLEQATKHDPDYGLAWSLLANTFLLRADSGFLQKDAALTEIVGEQPFKRMADDSRYKAFLRQMKLPVPEDAI